MFFMKKKSWESGLQRQDYKNLSFGDRNAEILSLAQKKEITIADLKPYSFICISARFTPAYYKMLKTLCARAGFQPNIVTYTSNASSQLLNLRTNMDIFVTDKFYTSYGDPYFAWRPIKDTCSGVTATWKTDNKKKGLLDFIDAMNEFTNIAELF